MTLGLDKPGNDASVPRLKPAGAIGLYDPEFEKDSCGVGFVAHIKGERSHEIITDASY